MAGPTLSTLRTLSALCLVTLLLLPVAGCREPRGSCQETAQCLASEVCYQRWCRTSCNTLDQCLGGEVCRDGLCLPAGQSPADGGAIDRASSDRGATDRAADALIATDALLTADGGGDAARVDARLPDVTRPPDASAQDSVPLDVAGGDRSGTLDGALSTDGPTLADGSATDVRSVDADLGCTLATVYWDQPATCHSHYACRYHLQSDHAACAPLLPLTSGYYEACSALEQCPPGTLCTSSVYGFRCAPVCSAPHLACPWGPDDAGPLCVHDLRVDSGMRLCDYDYRCDPISGGGCDAGSCHAVSTLRLCASVDGGGANSSCLAWSDCMPTYSCYQQQCRRLCNPATAPSPCPVNRPCRVVSGQPYAMCLPALSDAGNPEARVDDGSPADGSASMADAVE